MKPALLAAALSALVSVDVQAAPVAGTAVATYEFSLAFTGGVLPADFLSEMTSPSISSTRHYETSHSAPDVVAFDDLDSVPSFDQYVENAESRKTRAGGTEGVATRYAYTVANIGIPTEALGRTVRGDTQSQMSVPVEPYSVSGSNDGTRARAWQITNSSHQVRFLSINGSIASDIASQVTGRPGSATVKTSWELFFRSTERISASYTPLNIFNGTLNESRKGATTRLELNTDIGSTDRLTFEAAATAIGSNGGITTASVDIDHDFLLTFLMAPGEILTIVQEVAFGSSVASLPERVQVPLPIAALPLLGGGLALLATLAERRFTARGKQCQGDRENRDRGGQST